MKNDEKAIIAGAGAVLAYLYMEKDKEKKRISPMCLYPLRNFMSSNNLNNVLLNT